MARGRSSSNLGADIPGDTSAPAMSTMNEVSPIETDAPKWDKPEVSQSSEKSLKSQSKRRKSRSLLRRFKDKCLKHTWLLPLLMLIVLLALYAVNPNPSNPLHSAIFLSYPQGPKTPGGPVMYGKGPKDIAFVSFYTIVLSFTREFIMQRIIRPWAIYCGIRGKGKTARFMEQVYTAIYFGIFGPFGLYVMYRSDIWYFNTTAMYEGFPHREHEALFKAYYLLQASYWAQQAIVLLLQLEKPRKDFKELVGHHIITLALIALSYRFHFTYMGLAVYITHDVSDFFLATSKTLNYLDSFITPPYFGMFVGMWIYCRHYLNLKILWAVLTEFRTVGPFELNWETQQYKCWISQYITFALLASLQAVNLFWLFLILRILKNYVFNSIRKDERSDDEDTEEEEEAEQEQNGRATLATGAQVPTVTARNIGKENQAPQVLVNGEPLNEKSSSRR
ncbi:putative ceramide synthase membrane component (LAG1) [Aspergillus bombycis]|uniref:Putative ceramide synthase membrane component (LAG1) n=1 Tax=Aspergillus bombycis TaxID=109264 RepID=A0A1F8AHI7_9EURO|nr:putative ceramide synthase membrane component (LAG1) [Aspergillus bombycis]OGM51220.1 putative ceramide synthase membrane component (LAG1) [Aspergillus bombycis]